MRNIEEIKNNPCLRDIEPSLDGGILLPTNCTNGDVIKTLFNVKDDDIKTFKLSNMAIVDTWDWRMEMNLDWWNAPYKAESEDK